MRGFTLIELLVVITIIGILGAIGLNTFPQAQKQASDQTRKSDISQYRVALEAYANAHDGFYPGGAQTAIPAKNLCTISDWVNFASACPEDPKFSTDSTFQYKFTADGTSLSSPTSTNYVLWAKLETVSSPTTYWFVCSNGKSGNATSGIPTSNGSCPL